MTSLVPTVLMGRLELRRALLATGLYFGAAMAAIFLSRVPGAVNTLWYASGVSAAILQARPTREWPLLLGGITAAELSVNIIAGHTPGFALVSFAANLSEILVGAALLRHACRVDEAFINARMLCRVLLLGSILPAAAGASLGAIGMGLRDGTAYAPNWQFWFEGSWIGSISVLPIALFLTQRGPRALAPLARDPRIWASLGLLPVLAAWGPAALPFAYAYITGALLLLTAFGRFAAAAAGVLLTSLLLGAPIATGMVNGLPGTEALGRALLYLPVALILVPPLLLATMLERLRLDMADLTSREAHFRQLYQRAPVMMHSVDCRRRIIDVNDAWLERLGYQREEVLGRDSTDFLTPASRAHAEATVIPRFLREGVLRDEDYEFVTRTGECVAVQVSAIWERDAEGRPLRTFSVVKDVSEVRMLADRMAFLAHHDALTGLPNRLMFQQMAQDACARGAPFAMLFMDLDDFKRINDSLGHAVGDELLKAVARRLPQVVQGASRLCRLGGDEFVILASGMLGQAELSAFATRLLAEIARPGLLSAPQVEISASLGIARFPEDGQDPEALMKHADAAMYRSKREGRNRYGFFSRQVDQHAAERLQLELDLRQGLQREEFLLHYQPVVEAATGVPIGVEALARWHAPDGGEIRLPAAFIPAAEESGMIVALGAQLLKQACARIAAWRGTPWAELQMAVNVSMVQLAAPQFPTIVREALETSGVAGPQLTIEMTESTLMKNPEVTLAVVRRLKDLGVKIAIDDFGTGYSSLSYLRRFPVDIVKIDRSFVQDLTVNPGDRELVSAILAIARTLRLHAVAEGVETQDQARILGELGCPALQGFLFARPTGSEGLQAWLARQRLQHPGRAAVQVRH